MKPGRRRCFARRRQRILEYALLGACIRSLSPVIRSCSLIFLPLSLPPQAAARTGRPPPFPEPHDPLKHQVFVLDTHWRDGLEEILFGDPIPNLYSIEHYAAVPLPKSAPRIPPWAKTTRVRGCARGDTLCRVVLVGSNVVPVRLCYAPTRRFPGGGDCAEEGASARRTVTPWPSRCCRWGRTDSIFWRERLCDAPVGADAKRWRRSTERPSLERSVATPDSAEPERCLRSAHARAFERPVQPSALTSPRGGPPALYEAPLPALPRTCRPAGSAGA